jgi:diguanylate cyclase (GGDEF)-like protein
VSSADQRTGAPDEAAASVRTLVFRALIGFGVVLVGYLAWLIVQPEFHYSTGLNGWAVDGFEIVVSLLCILRGLLRQPGRLAAVALGLGFLSWAIGDTLATAYTVAGTFPTGPSWTDVFWLGFYPFAYVGVVLFIRQEVRRIAHPSWLDGAIAALGAAAVCAAFAFQSVLQSVGPTPLAVATNVAYPVGDLVLLALVVGAAALLSGRKAPSWALVASAMALNAIGDTFNLFKSSLATPRTGAIFFALAWPAAGLLAALAMWVRPRRANPLDAPQPAGFALPGLAALSSLVILLAGSLHDVSWIAAVLAAATLAVVGVRLTLSVWALRSVTQDRMDQSVTDELTGLRNRRYLVDALDAFFSEQSDPRVPRRPLALLYLDLDRFKQINDSFGHAAGDELLRQLGPRLTAVLGGGQPLVRLGGDELAVVLLDDDAAGAELVARRLVASVEEPFRLNGLRAVVSASVGIASASHATACTTLLHCADLAMYRAKVSGTSIACYDPSIDDDADRWSLGEDLRVAVEAGELELHYQPQLDIASGEVVAVEALLRWRHSRLGYIPPLRFLPLAERAGLMSSITAWVLDRALAQCAAWRSGGRRVAMSVNVSPSDLGDAGFGAMVQRALRKHELPAEALVVEITETSVIASFDEAKRAIEELRDFGVVVSIDDFGAGFTSMAYLSGLAVGELKLDGAFITGLSSGEPERARLVRATVQLGHAIGLRVVAECVEDRSTLELLRSYGCDVAQGYFVGRPAPADAVSFTTVLFDPVDVLAVAAY